ncbi:S4 domain-containing protein [Seleniivibrio sp.]|uniref:RNA-binding S4 domain-containing protein n=1 Tax=Seleniivibrio sp. TaxID=2898801 RepID=UPI0025DCA381|nr:S4 domain-containing protein [Seleniivibrio sp.]MCD8553748.1 RNA-binding S4 domain-containing protein [Seleniivibrio sp.]
MRVDKFLKVMMLIKRRTVANEMADEGFVKLNGRSAKPSAQIKAGDILEIDAWNMYKKIEIIALPEKGSVSKQDADKFIKTIEYKVKNDI